MAQVVVTIAGRTYRMNCEDGQEQHLHALAYEVDAKMAGLRGSFGEIGEQRLVVMAALTVADELSEARAKIAALQREVEGLSGEGRAAREARVARDMRLANTLASTAERMEKVARLLAGKG
jgi:cell division protein ZapA